jgi:hypothetical protein
VIKVLKSVVVGPLEPYAAGFAAELERQGYTAAVAEKQVGVAAHLSRWMAAAGLEPGDLTGQVADRYAAARRSAGYASYRSVHALEPLLGYLRGLGVAPVPQPLPATPAQELLQRFPGLSGVRARHRRRDRRGLRVLRTACRPRMSPRSWSRPARACRRGRRR